MKLVWRVVLGAVLLVGGLAALSLAGGGFQPPSARAERLKTTEEPLDPACNALGKLQVNVSPMEREEFSDENGGIIQACRYDVTLTNTDDQYAIRVFTNGSGSVDKGEEIFHTRHGHKALDPGESYTRDMYVIIYPDGSEEFFFYTYLKATYNDLDFPKDCRPTIDHLYTWDLPYRLVDTPCMDLSTDPPELVEWTPPEGLAVEPSGETSSGETGGETAVGESGEEPAPEAGSESGQPLSEDQQLAQQGSDLISQLTELLMMGDLGSLDQWEGWSGLNENQRANLLAIIDRLSERADEYIPPSQLALLNEVERQETLAQQRQDQLAQKLTEKYQAWERLDMLIDRERLRDKSDSLLWLYDNYRASQLLTAPYNEMRSWFDRLANPEGLAKDQAIEYLQEHTGTSIEDAAVEILKETTRMANRPALAHYAYYLQKYNHYRDEGMTQEDAHSYAMIDLQAVPTAMQEGLIEINNRNIWGGDFANNATPGGMYDRLFNELRGNYDPGVTP